jgi:signal peptidase
VLLLLVLGIVLALIPAMHHGSALTVLTGSMKPTINPGDVIVVYPVDSFDQIELGDVVTFMPYPDDPTLVSHRAVGWDVSDTGETILVTRGDANDTEERLMLKQVKAKMAYRVPLIGNVLEYTQSSRPYLIIALAAGLLIYAGYALVTSIRRN